MTDDRPEDIEEWRNVVGYEDLYDVSSLGRVRRSLRVQPVTNCKPGNIVSTWKDNGFHKVTLRRPKCKSSSQFYVHDLACGAFHGKRPMNHEVFHIDGQGTNNHRENLIWRLPGHHHTNSDCSNGEEWRQIVGFEGLYDVSNLGRIRRSPYSKIVTKAKPGCIIRGSLAIQDRYIVVQLGSRKSRKPQLVHELVCEAFHGPRPDGMYVAHYDGNGINNNANNLRWATQTENMQDAVRHGTTMRGSGHTQSKLTEDDVKIIRYRSDQGVPGNVLAIEFGVSETNISVIINRHGWRHVA